MVDWLAQLHRRVSHSDGSSSSSLEPTFRINNPRNRGRRVTSGGSIIRAPRRNVLSGDLSLSTEESGIGLQDWDATPDDCISFVDEAERRLVEPVEHLCETELDSCEPEDTSRELSYVVARNIDTINRMSEDEWMLR